jgi:hypothetical protein
MNKNGYKKGNPHSHHKLTFGIKLHLNQNTKNRLSTTHKNIDVGEYIKRNTAQMQIGNIRKHNFRAMNKIKT